MKKEARYVVGIDPGTHTGLAIWDRFIGAFIVVETTTILKAIDRIRRLAPIAGVQLRIEDARKRGGSAQTAIGAGSVRRDCNIWQEFADDHSLTVRWVRPSNSKKSLNKLPPKTFQKWTGWTPRTSHHARDAAMLVWKA